MQLPVLFKIYIGEQKAKYLCKGISDYWLLKGYLYKTQIAQHVTNNRMLLKKILQPKHYDLVYNIQIIKMIFYP